MIALAQWLDFVRLLWIHVPNESRGPVQHHVKRKRMGVRRGVADVLIFDPPPLFPLLHGAALELKRPDGSGELSDDQWVFLEEMKARRWATGVFDGADDAIAWLHKHLGYGLRA